MGDPLVQWVVLLRVLLCMPARPHSAWWEGAWGMAMQQFVAPLGSSCLTLQVYVPLRLEF